MAANGFKDETGKRYGRLTVLRRGMKPEGKKTKKAFWVCRCDCGNETTVMGEYLRNGDTQSCGCLLVDNVYSGDAARTHGLRKSLEYSVWANMIQRCTNPKATHYAEYGGRGIQVCDRWLKSFEAFYADMGAIPSRGHQIDRQDNNGHYEPGNCHWTTCARNSQNRRSTKLNEQAVKVIRFLCTESGFSQDRVARAYGVSQHCVSKIVRRISWRHV